MDLTPYIPQIITAVATLGGVLLTLIFTGRRDKARLALDQAKFDREVNKAAEIRFESIKREAFARHLYYANRLNFWMRQEDEKTLSFTLSSISHRRRFRELVEDYSRGREEISLLAPELNEDLEHVRDLLRGRVVTQLFQKRYPVDTRAETEEAIRRLRAKMQENLAIELPKPDDHNQPQLNETNPPGTPKSIQP